MINSEAQHGRLNQKRIVVTGGLGFVGRRVVSMCLAEGARVLIFDQAALPDLDDEYRSVFEQGAIFAQGSITSHSDCASMIQASISAFGGIDVLINTAGVLDPDDGGPAETTEEAWERTLEVNAKGVWLSCAAAIPHMKGQMRGSIVNVASLVGLRGSSVAQIAYTASKGAVVAMTREFAVHLARWGVRANSVCPGPLEGGLLNGTLDSESSVQLRKASIPMARLGSAEDVAYACVYLASDESSYITGTELIVDGGVSAAFIRPQIMGQANSGARG